MEYVSIAIGITGFIVCVFFLIKNYSARFPKQ